MYNITIGESEAKKASTSFRYSISVSIEKGYTAARHLTLPILANINPRNVFAFAPSEFTGGTRTRYP
jgi:hypothetical protein